MLYASVSHSKVLGKPSLRLCGRVVRTRPSLRLVTDKNVDKVGSVRTLGRTNVPTIMFNGTFCRKHVALRSLGTFLPWLLARRASCIDGGGRALS